MKCKFWLMFEGGGYSYIEIYAREIYEEILIDEMEYTKILYGIFSFAGSDCIGGSSVIWFKV